MVTRQTWAPLVFGDKSDVPFLLALRYMLQAANQPVSKWRFPSEKSPKPCYGRHNHRRLASKVVEGDLKRATAVGFEAVVGECSEKLGGGLGRQSLKGKLVVKARRVPERLGHDNHQDCVALPCAT